MWLWLRPWWSGCQGLEDDQDLRTGQEPGWTSEDCLLLLIKLIKCIWTV
jgi:hypothetical protein